MLIRIQRKVSLNGITLLTSEEASGLSKDVLYGINTGYWWLSDPAEEKGYVSFVATNTVNNNRGFDPCEQLAVRPVLLVDGLHSGEMFSVFGHNWTMITDTQALCNEAIAKRRFDEKSTVWKRSELKKWLEGWLEEQLDLRVYM